MTATRFRELALSLPEATEGAHMGHPDFRVGARIFATLNADESGAAIKCDPANIDALVRSDHLTFRDAWGGRWLGVALDRAQEADVAELLEDAWRTIAPRRVVAAYDARGR